MSVYFARVRDYVKIGYSKDPYTRIGTITTGTCIKPADVEYGDQIDLLGWIPGDRAIERRTHREFASFHVVGEWFWDDDIYEESILDNAFGILPHDLPAHVVSFMTSHPDVRRVDAVRALEAVRTAQLADPNSPESRARDMLGEGFASQVYEMFLAERARDRDYWRSRRITEAVAS